MKEMLKGSDQVTVLDRFAPISQAAATVTGAWLPAFAYAAYIVKVQAGVLGASATLDAKLQQATDGSGTGAKDVTGSAITQLVKATDDGKFSLINLDPNKLDVANGFDYFRVSMTVGTAASLISAEVLGIHPRYGIPSHNAALAQVVTP